MPVTLTLPFPPSLNNLFGPRRPRSGHSRGRYPVEKYVAWRRQAETSIMIARPPSTSGPVRISLMLHPADARRRDCDNLLKPVLDSLVRMAVIDADDGRIVKSASAEWGEKRNPPEVVVTITPYE